MTRPATRGDLDAIAVTYARAFADDPLFEWLVPDRRRWDRHAHRLFRAAVRPLLGEGQVWVAEGAHAAATWAPPGFRPEEWRQVVDLPGLAWLLGRRWRDALRYDAATKRARPKAPHWYLAVLGTDPAHQGRGLAGAVLAPVLTRADDEGVGCYLESSKEANLAYYGRHGFALTGVLEPVPDGPPVWTMWREPVAP